MSASVSSVAPQGLPAAGAWDLEPNHSTVGFRVIHHAISTYRTGFDRFEARYDADAGTFTGSVAVDSVRAFPPLHEKLLSDEFFDAANHPEIRFASTAIECSGNSLAVEGELTLHGVTRPVRAEGVVLGTAPVFHYPTQTTHEHFGIDLELTIDRREFGMSWNAPLPNGLLNLGSHVAIELSLEFLSPEPLA